MKITMVSNFYNSHQHSIASEFYKVLGADYSFIETCNMNAEQKNLGYTAYDLPYIKKTFEKNKDQAYKAIKDADILISGGFTDFAWQRIRANKPTFIFSERLFVGSILPMFKPKRLIEYIKRIKYFNRRDNVYFLCASSYLSYDLTRIGFSRKNMLKFGYFPPFDSSDFEARNNDPIKILWCGRMIDWKQGEHVIYMSKKLKDMGYDFTVSMIGDGNQKDIYLKLIDDYELSDHVSLYPPIKQIDMLDTMKKYDIFIQPSNYKEGWGAVINEAMSCGCVVISSSGVGSSNYLIEDNISGYIYNNGDISALADIVADLIANRDKCEMVGTAAQQRIQSLWNGKVAAQSLMSIFDDVINKRPISYKKEGPCSFAQIIKSK